MVRMDPTLWKREAYRSTRGQLGTSGLKAQPRQGEPNGRGDEPDARIGEMQRQVTEGVGHHSW
jgi:hypothetical protein